MKASGISTNNFLGTYLHDHLGGAKVAVALLMDLSEQTVEPLVARFASGLLNDVEVDRSVLQDMANQIGESSNTWKEAAGWMAEKAGRSKLKLSDPFGVFEAIELLTLGVLGKLALWNALKTTADVHSRLAGFDLESLIARATNQHSRLEELRLRVAASVLRSDPQ